MDDDDDDDMNDAGEGRRDALLAPSPAVPFVLQTHHASSYIPITYLAFSNKSFMG